MKFPFFSKKDKNEPSQKDLLDKINELEKKLENNFRPDETKKHEPVGGQLHRFTQEDRTEMFNLIQQGETVQVIAKKFKCDVATVRYHVTQYTLGKKVKHIKHTLLPQKKFNKEYQKQWRIDHHEEVTRERHQSMLKETNGERPKYHESLKECPYCFPESKLTWEEYRKKICKLNLGDVEYAKRQNEKKKTVDEIREEAQSVLKKSDETDKLNAELREQLARKEEQLAKEKEDAEKLRKELENAQQTTKSPSCKRGLHHVCKKHWCECRCHNP